jgi:hypothetical protein
MSEAILRLARQIPGATAGHCTALTLLALAWGCQAFGYSQPADSLWMVATGGVVLLGAAALGWLRPQRVGFTAPQAMLLLGATGMLLGLAVDSHAMEVGTLASLCGQADKSLWPMLKLHWALLPWMHVGMWVGGFAAIPLLRSIRPTCRRQYCARVAQNIACSVWMTVGMAVGVLLFESLIAQVGQRSAASMLGGMFGGMVWGMVASVALYRLYFLGRPATQM